MGCAQSGPKQKVVKLNSVGVLGSSGLDLDNAGFRHEDDETDRRPQPTEGGETAQEPIVIVGIGCRTPGADNIQEYWRVLVNGECHVTDVPEDRWNAAAFLSQDHAAPGKAYVQKGGFLSDVEGFDNGLYGISNFEASDIDPQQCLLLDCTTMAMQDAGITRQQLSGSNTGVYIGTMNSDHRTGTLGMNSKVGAYTATSRATSLLANRLSFVFNLLGPSMALDTACSAALISIHVGRQAILSGDCDQAICGGVNCMLLPDVFVHLSKARIISPTGLCHTFSNKADGYTRGEGCGVVILKRLSDAQRDGDHIWATVCTGTNHNGHTVVPVTAPSGEQQKQLLHSVYSRFPVDLSQLDYIEAHGTGTPTGDVVEVNALGDFLKEKGQQRQCYIGSVKTNIGHTESAAGVLSVIKLCLMMKYNTIVPSLHCDVVHPGIDLKDLKFVIPKTTVPWTKPDKLTCCNSSGFGGSNCHALLQTVKREKRERFNKAGGSPCIVCFSGKSVKSLKGSLEDLIRDPASFELDIHDVSYTSTVRRDHHRLRAAFLVDDMQGLHNAARQRLSRDQSTPPRQQKVVFVFCGMGTSWEGMCRQLLEQHRVFKDTLMEVEKHLSRYVPWSLTERLVNDDPSKDLLLDPIAVFACQVGLVEVWRSLGILPSCVVGQSLGEVAAAYTAGCFSLADAVKIIYHRSRLLAEVAGGAMVVLLDVEVDKVRQTLAECEQGASISQEYSNKACAISAPSDIMPSVKLSLQTKLNAVNTGMQIIDLSVQVPYHSPHVGHCAEELTKKLKGMVARPPSVHMLSSVSGNSLTSAPDAKYWAKNLRDPVLLKQAMTESVKGSQKAVCLEIGPRPVLKAHLGDLFPGQKVTALPSVVKAHEITTLLKTVMALYEDGLDITWTALPSKGSEPTAVPRYSFDKKSQADKTETYHVITSGLDFFQKNHLYTCPVRSSTTSFRAMISPLTISSVYDHVLSGKIIVPGAFLAEACFAVAHFRCMSHPAVSIEFERPMSLNKGEVTEIIAEFERSEDSASDALPPLVMKNENRRLASAQLTENGPSPQEAVNLDYIRATCKDIVDKSGIYSALQGLGFQYGPNYALLEKAGKTSSECWALLKMTDSVQHEARSTYLHPSILDCMLQSSSLVLLENMKSNRGVLPKSIGRLTVHRPAEPTMYVYTRLKRISAKHCVLDQQLLSPTGQVIADMADFNLQFLQSPTQETDTLLTTQWNRVMDTPASFLEGKPQDRQGKSAFLFVTDTESVANNGHNIAVSFRSKNAVADVISKVKQTLAGQSGSLSGVVLVCSAKTDSNTDGSTVQDRVVTMCCLIQAILQTMKDLFLRVAFYVCTVNAWPSAAGNTGSGQTNPVATALWGLVRTLLLERVHTSITAVELCLPSGLVSLPDVFSCLAETESVRDYPELMVTPDGIFVNQVVKDRSSPLSDRLPSPAETKGITEGNNTLAANSSLALQHPPQAHTSDQKSVVLKIQDFIPGSDELLRGKIRNAEQATEESVQTTVVLELKGFSPERSEVQVACCCPVMRKPEVTVPAELVVPTSQMPNYQLGDLIKLIVLWELHCGVQMQELTTLTILASTTTSHLAELLKMFCIAPEKKDPHTVKIVLLDELESSVVFSGNVISLVYIDTNLTSFVTKHWQRAEGLVTFTSLLSPEGVSLLMCERPDIKLTLLDTQTLFHPEHLKKAVPQVMSWMTTNASYMNELAKSLHHPSAKANTTDINKLFQFSQNAADAQDNSITDARFKKDAAYIVVGGLTGLGWICVQFLACQNAGYIAIINRSSPSADQTAAINDLVQTYRCQIQAYQADITAMESVQQVFSQVGSTGFQIRGVFFGAAVLKDSPFLAMTNEDFHKVLGPKIKGAWNLHQLTKAMPLDYFVLHSSIVSVLGNPGQANYAAGNAFLDGLAWHRYHLGLAAQTVNWGPLDTGLLGQQDVLKQRMESTGFHIAGHQEIHSTLAAVLDLKQTQTVPARMDPKLYSRKLYESQAQPVILRFHKFAPPARDNKQNLARSSMEVSRIKSLSPESRHEAYEMYVTEVVSQLLVVDMAEVTPDVPLSTLGMDSMSGIMLLEHLQRDTTFSIPDVEVIYDGVTIRSLAGVLTQYSGGLEEKQQFNEEI